MNPLSAHFSKLLKYNHWANLQVAIAMSEVEDPKEYGSRLLSHIMHAERMWLFRVTGKDTSDINLWEIVPVIFDLAGSGSITGEWLQVMAESTIEDFAKEIPYYTTEKEFKKAQLEDIITHLLNHSSYHRGQLMSYIRRQGGQVPRVDYIYYVYQNQHAV